jgi:hypothetical protein
MIRGVGPVGGHTDRPSSPGVASPVGVERTFFWLGRCRRVAREYECKPEHAEARIQVAVIRLMAARLVGEEIEPIGAIATAAARRLAKDLNQQ